MIITAAVTARYLNLAMGRLMEPITSAFVCYIEFVCMCVFYIEFLFFRTSVAASSSLFYKDPLLVQAKYKPVCYVYCSWVIVL